MRRLVLYCAFLLFISVTEAKNINVLEKPLDQFSKITGESEEKQLDEVIDEEMRDGLRYLMKRLTSEVMDESTTVTVDDFEDFMDETIKKVTLPTIFKETSMT